MTPGMPSPDTHALLTLNLASGLGPILIKRAMDTLGSAQAVVGASVAELRRVQGIGQDKAIAIRQSLDALSDGQALSQEYERMAELGVEARLLGQPGYPRLLTLIPDPPPVLYVRGKLDDDNRLALGVVGSRKCSAYGREQADRLSAFCAQAGLTIVSGGAYGIDASAHRATLRVQGKTIIVLGSGLARPYPADHIDLFEQAVEQGSAVVSEHPMTTPPRAEYFPRRNRIISGLSLGVLVIEAALRSGALITARLAMDDHNREVLALPGRVDSPASAGCHKILREGWATLITCGQDILEALGETGQLLQARLPEDASQATPPAKPMPAATSLFELNLTPTQQTILQALDQPCELEGLAVRTKLTIPRIQADLTLLQIRGLVARQGRYIARTPRS